MMDTFDYIRRNILPYRTKVLNEVAGLLPSVTTSELTSQEKITIETTTHLHYPVISADKIGYNSTVYDDSDTNPSVLPVVGVYGFDYEAQPPNTTIDPNTGASIDVNEVNGLISESTTSQVIFDTTT